MNNLGIQYISANKNNGQPKKREREKEIKKMGEDGKR